MDDPDDFVGEQLSLSGDLSRVPGDFCNTKARRFPTNWILSDGDIDVPVASTSSEFSQFDKDIQNVLLSGRWLHWKGPVGCGTEIEVAEQWYLDVSRFAAPNSVAVVPVLTPSPRTTSILPEPEEIAPESEEMAPELEEVAPESEEVAPESEESLVSPASPSPSVVGEVQVTQTTTPAPQGPALTPVNTVIPSTATANVLVTTPSGQSPEPIFSTTTPAQDVPGLSTATATIPPVTPTVGETSASTPLVIATQDPLLTVFRMALDLSSIETGGLGIGEIHRWTYEITSTERLTINLASDYLLDVAVSIVDPAGQTIAQQNNASNGEPEILGDVTLMNPGVYDILVSSPSGEPGNYSILVSNEESYTFIFQGTLRIGDVGSATMVFENDHFWHFTGTAGQAISIVVVPADESDLFLNLFDTAGFSLIRFHDETGSGEPEQLIGYVLPESGIYSLRVGEYNFGPAEYEIFLTDG